MAGVWDKLYALYPGLQPEQVQEKLFATRGMSHTTGPGSGWKYNPYRSGTPSAEDSRFLELLNSLPYAEASELVNASWYGLPRQELFPRLPEDTSAWTPWQNLVMGNAPSATPVYSGGYLTMPGNAQLAPAWANFQELPANWANTPVNLGLYELLTKGATAGALPEGVQALQPLDAWMPANAADQIAVPELGNMRQDAQGNYYYPRESSRSYVTPMGQRIEGDTIPYGVFDAAWPESYVAALERLRPSLASAQEPQDTQARQQAAYYHWLATQINPILQTTPGEQLWGQAEKMLNAAITYAPGSQGISGRRSLAQQADYEKLMKDLMSWSPTMPNAVNPGETWAKMSDVWKTTAPVLAELIDPNLLKSSETGQATSALATPAWAAGNLPERKLWGATPQNQTNYRNTNSWFTPRWG